MAAENSDSYYSLKSAPRASSLVGSLYQLPCCCQPDTSYVQHTLSAALANSAPIPCPILALYHAMPYPYLAPSELVATHPLLPHPLSACSTSPGTLMALGLATLCRCHLLALSVLASLLWGR